MRTKSIFLTALLAVSIAIFSFTSCTNENLQITDQTTLTTTEDAIQTAQISDGITNQTEFYLSALETVGYNSNTVQNTQGNRVSAIPYITIDKPDSTSFPKVITIDFGTSGFITQGDTIRGKVIITITNRMYIANSSRSLEFINFSVNSNEVSGTKTITYKGKNDSGNPYWTISSDLAFNLADGRTTTWTSERTRERISDNDTPYNFWDDTYSLKGTASGINFKGNEYTIEINDTNPLILISGYPFFVKGDATITVGTRTAIIDFGDGTKDNIATITINGVTKEIVLKR